MSMKMTVKKALALFLSALMILSASVVAFAEDSNWVQVKKRVLSKRVRLSYPR